MIPRLLLECGQCHHRPSPESALEAFRLHCQVEHDTDELRANLIAVCDCGATMVLDFSQPRGQRVEDVFLCPADGARGSVWRDRTPAGS